VLLTRFPDREQEHDRLSEQTPADKSQDLARWFIEPLGIVDKANQRAFRGHLGKQAKYGKAHKKPIRSVPVREPEHDPQRLLLPLRQSRQILEHRPAQLVQGRKWHFQLGLDSSDPDDSTASRLASAVVHQRGLADPGLAAHDQRRALSLANAIQHGVERRALAPPPPEGWGSGWDHVPNDNFGSG
jgi:hypothetical protein